MDGRGGCPVAGDDEAGFVRDDDGLGAVAQASLASTRLTCDLTSLAVVRLGQVGILVLAVLTVTAEYSTRTIGPTLMAVPLYIGLIALLEAGLGLLLRDTAGALTAALALLFGTPVVAMFVRDPAGSTASGATPRWMRAW